MDLNDYPAGRLFALKPALLIAGGVVFLILVIFILVRVLSGDSSEELLLENLQTQSGSSADTCDGTQNPEKCRIAYISDLAQQQASSQACGLLETDVQKDNCYWGIAHASLDPVSCERISDGSFVSRCKDDVAESQAIDQSSVALCEDILDEARQERCVFAVSGPLTSENCSERAPNLCDDLALFEQAKVSGDTIYCREIVDESFSLSCFDAVEDLLALNEIFQEDDSDQDGLTDREEQTYGSDPQNPDSDGDGYLDGAEVSSGYDPVGPGLLPQS
jgi:hypothetical protein